MKKYYRSAFVNCGTTEQPSVTVMTDQLQCSHYFEHIESYTVTIESFTIGPSLGP